MYRECRSVIIIKQTLIKIIADKCYDIMFKFQRLVIAENISLVVSLIMVSMFAISMIHLMTLLILLVIMAKMLV